MPAQTKAQATFDKKVIREEFDKIMKKQCQKSKALLGAIKKDPPSTAKMSLIAWSDKITSLYLNKILKEDLDTPLEQNEVHKTAFEYARSIKEGTDKLRELCKGLSDEKKGEIVKLWTEANASTTDVKKPAPKNKKPHWSDVLEATIEQQ